ncbi:MAG: prenyltransferase [Pseudomonadota bacterium]
MMFIPLLIGQALALQAHDQFSLAFFLGTALFGILFQVHLLYLNDYADAALDQSNEQYWLSGGSRVLPEGKLQRHDLLAGTTVALLLMLGLSLLLGIAQGRPWMFVGVLAAVALSWAYNLRPLQLSYRGHGEILQGLGCGVLLPLIGFYMQQASLSDFPWATLVPLYLIFHAGNIITALPDYQSDKAGRKNTVPVRRGEHRARKAALLLIVLAIVGVVLVSLQMPPLVLTLIALPSSLILFGIMATGTLRMADVANFSICKRFVNWTSASQAWLLCTWSGALMLSRSL